MAMKPNKTHLFSISELHARGTDSNLLENQQANLGKECNFKHWKIVDNRDETVWLING
jgi:hypothetical protein